MPDICLIRIVDMSTITCKCTQILCTWAHAEALRALYWLTISDVCISKHGRFAWFQHLTNFACDISYYDLVSIHSPAKSSRHCLFFHLCVPSTPTMNSKGNNCMRDYAALFIVPNTNGIFIVKLYYLPVEFLCDMHFYRFWVNIFSFPLQQTRKMDCFLPFSFSLHSFLIWVENTPFTIKPSFEANFCLEHLPNVNNKYPLKSYRPFSAK